MKLTNKKIIISGATIEEYVYGDKPVSYDFIVPKQNRRRKIIVTDEKSRIRKEESKKHSLYRTNSNLRRLVNTNAWYWLKGNNKPYMPVFVTFTFKDNVQDIKSANRIFSNFIKRLNYKVGSEDRLLKYVVVIEFQKRGAIHYHTIFFNLKFIEKKTLEDLWGHGYIKLKSIKNVDNAGAYISKYMSKDFADDRLDGLKHYFSSRNLHKPIEIKNQFKAHRIAKLIPKEYITKEKEFNSAYHGKVKYIQYKLEKKLSLFNVILNLKELL